MPRLVVLYFSSLCLCASVVSASFSAELTYWQDVRPLLRRHCTVCHSVRTLKEPDVSGGLALDSRAAILKGAKQPVVVPGKPDESELIRRLHVADPAKRMPLDADPLPPETIDVLRRWVAAGAPEGTLPARPAGAASSMSRWRRNTRRPSTSPRSRSRTIACWSWSCPSVRSPRSRPWPTAPTASSSPPAAMAA